MTRTTKTVTKYPVVTLSADYADDVAYLSHSGDSIEDKGTALHTCASKLCVCISKERTRTGLTLPSNQEKKM